MVEAQTEGGNDAPPSVMSPSVVNPSNGSKIRALLERVKSRKEETKKRTWAWAKTALRERSGLEEGAVVYVRWVLNPSEESPGDLSEEGGEGAKGATGAGEIGEDEKGEDEKGEDKKGEGEAASQAEDGDDDSKETKESVQGVVWWPARVERWPPPHVSSDEQKGKMRSKELEEDSEKCSSTREILERSKRNLSSTVLKQVEAVLASTEMEDPPVWCLVYEPRFNFEEDHRPVTFLDTKTLYHLPEWKACVFKTKVDAEWVPYRSEAELQAILALDQPTRIDTATDTDVGDQDDQASDGEEDMPLFSISEALELVLTGATADGDDEYGNHIDDDVDGNEKTSQNNKDDNDNDDNNNTGACGIRKGRTEERFAAVESVDVNDPTINRAVIMFSSMVKRMFSDFEKRAKSGAPPISADDVRAWTEDAFGGAFRPKITVDTAPLASPSAKRRKTGTNQDTEAGLALAAPIDQGNLLPEKPPEQAPEVAGGAAETAVATVSPSPEQPSALEVAASVQLQSEPFPQS